jgi:hypothetical protein
MYENSSISAHGRYHLDRTLSNTIAVCCACHDVNTPGESLSSCHWSPIGHFLVLFVLWISFVIWIVTFGIDLTFELCHLKLPGDLTLGAGTLFLLPMGD